MLFVNHEQHNSLGGRKAVLWLWAISHHIYRSTDVQQNFGSIKKSRCDHTKSPTKTDNIQLHTESIHGLRPGITFMTWSPEYAHASQPYIIMAPLTFFVSQKMKEVKWKWCSVFWLVGSAKNCYPRRNHLLFWKICLLEILPCSD